ncbi:MULTISPECIES: tyrosine-type recombinase/integrase [Halomicrobium]|uniref:Integrase-like protein n=2 Tax=Halomicrobium mukohataei TaxID=57705 RepID=C7NWF2_HALMD|nr:MULTISPECIES: site-specific integrase [Halomicrobium]ACV46293.1 integrase-like protein [Halomicrobium mukohataei DSM 12286]QCD64851.1 site-specific integrase [Halomicrobium mukohataei]QFR19657.1 site-specific integrase [Halomicrobium sp. ZPS1]
MSDDLEPLSPSEAVDLYIEARDDATEQTLQGQYYRLQAFIQWCDEEGIANLNELSGRDLYAYRVWRREGGYSDEGKELKTVTLRGDMGTLRAFLRFCGDIEAVPEALYEQVPLPKINPGQDVSESTPDPDRALEILDWLERYEYASRRHVIVLLFWHTGCRTGGLRALDVGDCDLDGDRPGADGPAVHFVHRPNKGTPLKNKEKGERWNAISPHVAQILKDYIDGPREKETDDQGRAPLVTTKSGRVSRSCCRDTLYRVSPPCWRGEECPHDKDPDTCEWTHYSEMSKCPSSRSPHDVRSGRVTAHRLADEDRSLVSDRMNASEEILDKHYDRRNDRQKAEQRRNFFEL